MNRTKKTTAVILTLILVWTLGSCNRQVEMVKYDRTSQPSAEKSTTSGRSEPALSEDGERNPTSADSPKQGEIIGDYLYPENPAEQLRNALEEDRQSHGLPCEIGNIETIELNDREYSQIRIDFTNGNVCSILFLNRYVKEEQDVLLDGNANPSFTMAFKDSENTDDMIAVLVPVLLYLSPDLSREEAERLAVNQNDTIATDGYAMPQDIGGYQVQARYTNPNVFFYTPDFEAKLGVNIRALKQIWRSTLDTALCEEMKTPGDFEMLDQKYPYWEDDAQSKVFYADFLVKNIWQGKSYLHGETWVIVDVESTAGRQYSFVLDTWKYPVAYEFGVGQQYSIFIRWAYSVEIIYAVQLSESNQFHSRGEMQPIDYPTDDWREPVYRIEPEGEGTVWDVSFHLQSQTYSEQYAALEGNGIGEQQWPADPAQEGYTFAGWYDNKECEGEPYTQDTPVYADTDLYAKWSYSGPGGTWPRAKRGGIQGIDEGAVLPAGQRLTITADGYNMDMPSPKDQRFRWRPVEWRLSDGTGGSFSYEAPFQAELSPDGMGEHRIYVTYAEEIYDGTDWQTTRQIHEVEEEVFRVG